MKRRAFKYLPRGMALLLIGAIINVILAWVCALWSDRAVVIENGVPSRTSGLPSVWSKDIFTSSDRKFLADIGSLANVEECQFRTTFGLDRRAFLPAVNWNFIGFQTQTALLRHLTPLPEAMETKSGWPLLSMRAWQWLNSANPAGQPFSYDSPLVITIGSATTYPIPARRVLPIRVIWLGFVVNAAIFGAAVWCLLFGIQFIRRSIRAGWNCCSECGYPIGTSAVCTECGSPIDRDRTRIVISRREAIRFFVCVPIGAALSVLIGWLCVLYAPVLYLSDQPHRIEGPPWWTDVGAAHPNSHLTGLGFRVEVFDSGYWGCHLVRCGWPMTAFEHAVEYWQNSATRVEHVRHGMRLPAWLHGRTWDRKCLPLRPNWSGIAVNALAWSVISWSVWWGVRRMRQRHHHCRRHSRMPSPRDWLMHALAIRLAHDHNCRATSTAPHAVL